MIWFSSFHNVDPAKEPHGPGVWQRRFTGWADPAFTTEGVEGRAEPSVWEGRRRRPSEAEGYKPSPETLRCRPGYAVKAVTCLGAQRAPGPPQAARAAADGSLQPPACTAARRQHRGPLLAVAEPAANGARVCWQAAEGERCSSPRQPGVS